MDAGEAVIAYRLERAREALEDARILAKNKRLAPRTAELSRPHNGKRR